MINVIKIKPRGYCCGVASAIFKTIKICKEIKQKNKSLNNIYMIGHIIHNEFAINQLKQWNINILCDENSSRYQLVKNKVSNNSIIILSAHGTPKNVYEIAKLKNCYIVDTTCIYVKQTHDLIKQKLNSNYKIVFLGVKNHPETEAILDINKKIILIENINDLQSLKLKKNEKLFVTNQTTLSILDLQEIIDEIKLMFKNVEFENEICNATLLRQNAILDLKNQNIDLLISVGDKKSNNSKKLVEIGKSINIKSILVSNPQDININMFENVKNVAVTAGASTPYELTNLIEKKIESFNNELKFKHIQQ